MYEGVCLSCRGVSKCVYVKPTSAVAFVSFVVPSCAPDDAVHDVIGDVIGDTFGDALW